MSINISKVLLLFYDPHRSFLSFFPGSRETLSSAEYFSSALHRFSDYMIQNRKHLIYEKWKLSVAFCVDPMPRRFKLTTEKDSHCIVVQASHAFGVRLVFILEQFIGSIS